MIMGFSINKFFIESWLMLFAIAFMLFIYFTFVCKDYFYSCFLLFIVLLFSLFIIGVMLLY